MTDGENDRGVLDQLRCDLLVRASAEGNSEDRAWLKQCVAAIDAVAPLAAAGREAAARMDRRERIPTVDDASHIVAVAVRANGLIISMPAPARHFNIMKSMPAKMARSVLPSDQGFVTDTGHYVGREDALRIATAAGQLLKPTAHRELFSEDLW